MNIRTVAKGAVGLTKAAFGIHAVSEEIKNKRLAICETCPSRFFEFSEKYNMTIARCGECRCFIRAKVLIKEEFCDLYKWEKEK